MVAWSTAKGCIAARLCSSHFYWIIRMSKVVPWIPDAGLSLIAIVYTMVFQILHGDSIYLVRYWFVHFLNVLAAMYQKIGYAVQHCIYIILYRFTFFSALMISRANPWQLTILMEQSQQFQSRVLYLRVHASQDVRQHPKHSFDQRGLRDWRSSPCCKCTGALMLDVSFIFFHR